MKNNFPYSPCHICDERINFSEGVVQSNNYIPLLNSLKDSNNLLSDKIVLQYFRQFDLGEIPKSEESRLNKLLDKNPSQFLFLLAHQNCLNGPNRESIGFYDILLNELSTNKKVGDWKVHLEEKIWFNSFGWGIIREDLFGIN